MNKTHRPPLLRSSGGDATGGLAPSPPSCARPVAMRPVAVRVMGGRGGCRGILLRLNVASVVCGGGWRVIE